MIYKLLFITFLLFPNFPSSATPQQQKALAKYGYTAIGGRVELLHSYTTFDPKHPDSYLLWQQTVPDRQWDAGPYRVRKSEQKIRYEKLPVQNINDKPKTAVIGYYEYTVVLRRTKDSDIKLGTVYIELFKAMDRAEAHFKNDPKVYPRQVKAIVRNLARKRK